MSREPSAADGVELVLQLHAHDGGFVVTASSGGRGESDAATLSSSDVERLARLGEQLAGDDFSSRSEIEKAGEELFAAVFRGKVLELFIRAKTEAANTGGSLRMLVSLPERTALHEIPWEILRHAGTFLACTKASICRYVRHTERAPLLACSPPVSMLLTTAAPEDAPSLDLAAEEAKVRAGVEATNGLIRLTVQRGVSGDQLMDLFEDARRGGDPFRIWHHSGHGEVSPSGRFHLVLARNRQSELLEGVRIADFIASEQDLKLAVLSLCFGGTSLGLGTHLARLDVPAVVAFRSAVVDSAAIGFAATFYRHLPVVPVDVAVSRARARLAATDDFDWTQPILYARTERLRLCDVGAPASHPMNPRSGGTTFRNTGVRIGGKLRQIGSISSGEGAGSSEPAWPVEFINDRVEVRGDAEQIGDIRVGASGKTDFGARWRELLSVVSEEES